MDCPGQFCKSNSGWAENMYHRHSTSNPTWETELQIMLPDNAKPFSFLFFFPFFHCQAQLIGTFCWKLAVLYFFAFHNLCCAQTTSVNLPGAGSSGVSGQNGFFYIPLLLWCMLLWHVLGFKIGTSFLKVYLPLIFATNSV